MLMATGSEALRNSPAIVAGVRAGRLGKNGRFRMKAMLGAVGAFAPQASPQPFDSVQASPAEPAQRGYRTPVTTIDSPREVHLSSVPSRATLAWAIMLREPRSYRLFPLGEPPSSSALVALWTAETAPGCAPLTLLACPHLHSSLAPNLLQHSEVKKRMSKMKPLKLCFTLLPLVVAGMLVGCSRNSVKSADVSDNIRQSLDQANLKDVSAIRAE